MAGYTADSRKPSPTGLPGLNIAPLATATKAVSLQAEDENLGIARMLALEPDRFTWKR